MNETEKGILDGLEEALTFAKESKKGSTSKAVKTHHVKPHDVDIRDTRLKLGLTQDRFADTFGVSIATVRNWEQGRRQPRGAAKVLLSVIHHHPEAVISSL